MNKNKSRFLATVLGLCALTACSQGGAEKTSANDAASPGGTDVAVKDVVAEGDAQTIAPNPVGSGIATVRTRELDPGGPGDSGMSVQVKGKAPAPDDRSYLNLSMGKLAVGDQKKKKLNANYHFNNANTFREKRQYNDAIEEYKRAIRSYPADGAFYKNLGGTFAMVGKFDDAEAVLSRGTEISPDDWLMWNNLAVVLQQLNKNKECVAAIKKSMALNPPDYEKENMTLTLKKLEASTN